MATSFVAASYTTPWDTTLGQMLCWMEDDKLTSALDTRIRVGLEQPRRVEVLSGMAGRRQLWTLEQKLALVADMEH